MNTYLWSSLDEEERYGVWSMHINAGGKDISFFAFCDLMDNIFSKETSK